MEKQTPKSNLRGSVFSSKSVYDYSDRLLGLLISRVFLEKTADGAAMREAARRAGIELILPTIEAPYWREEEYRVAFTRMAEESVEGVVVGTMVENWTFRRFIIALAKEFRLPSIYPDRIFVELGGMMSCGPNTANAGRDCARVVAGIFNGPNPANIPISQPTKYELCFNLNTAKALGSGYRLCCWCRPTR